MMLQKPEVNELASKIFKRLDVSGSGNLSRSDFILSLKEVNIPPEQQSEYLSVFYRNPSLNTVSYDTFLAFMINQDQKLRMLFNQLDKDKDGLLSPKDLKQGMEEIYNYEVEEEVITYLIQKMDRDHDGNICYDEWRNFLLLIPSARLDYVFEFWAQTFSGFVDITEQHPLQIAQGVAQRNLTKSQSDLLTWFRNFLAGAIAGIVSRTSTAPLERLKILYQVNYVGSTVAPPNIFRGLYQVYSRDGAKGLFRGNFTNILKATPDTAIRFAIFEHLKTLLKNKKLGSNTEGRIETLDARELFFAGAVAGVTSNFTVYPLDVIKIRISAAPTGTYKGILDAFRKISRTEGRIRPFYRGLSASLFSSVPNAGLNLMTYELLKKIILKNSLPQKDPPVYVMMGMGGLSALISSTLLYPFSTVCSRLIMQGLKPSISEKDRKVTQVVKNIVRYEGPRGFFKGYLPAISKIILGSAISFGTFETLKTGFGIDSIKR